jgi:hypothetical protein
MVVAEIDGNVSEMRIIMLQIAYAKSDFSERVLLAYVSWKSFSF